MSLAKHSPMLARLESLHKYTENKGLEGGDLVPDLPPVTRLLPSKIGEKEKMFSLADVYEKQD